MRNPNATEYQRTNISGQAKAQLGDSISYTIQNAYFYTYGHSHEGLLHPPGSSIVSNSQPATEQELPDVHPCAIGKESLPDRHPSESYESVTASQINIENIAALERVKDLTREAFLNNAEGYFREEVHLWWSASDYSFLCMEIGHGCGQEHMHWTAADIFDQSTAPKLIYLLDGQTGIADEQSLMGMLDSLVQQAARLFNHFTGHNDIASVSINSNLHSIQSKLQAFSSFCLAYGNQNAKAQDILIVLEGFEVLAAASPQLSDSCLALVSTIRALNADSRLGGRRIRTVLLEPGRGKLFSGNDSDVQFLDVENQISQIFL